MLLSDYDNPKHATPHLHAPFSLEPGCNCKQEVQIIDGRRALEHRDTAVILKVVRELLHGQVTSYNMQESRS